MRYGHKLVVDHINHRKTDNRFENLRVCSYQENSRNMKRREATHTTGVCMQMCGTTNYIVSFINSNHKQIKKYYNIEKTRRGRMYETGHQLKKALGKNLSLLAVRARPR